MTSGSETLAPSATAALRVSGVGKSFNGTVVLQDVGLCVRAGSIHALVGHNGSGKSTLIKVLAGFHQPDEPVEGHVFDDPVRLGDHGDAERAGLRFVHQDLGLVDSLSAVDNLALGSGYPRTGGLIRWSSAARRTREVLSSLGYEFDVHRPVGQLSASQRAGIAIARALQDWSGKRAVVVLDEPTAAMPAHEVEVLFRAIRTLRDHGLGVVYVSHHLGEILELADDVTVLRGGRVVESRPVDGLSHDDLVELIIGSAPASSATAPLPADPARGGSADSPPLRVRGLACAEVEHLDLQVAPGEIVGVLGVDGSGRDAILGALAGFSPRSGSVEVAGVPVTPGRPSAAIRAGIGYVAADRLRTGVIPHLDVVHNLTISGLSGYRRFGLVSQRAESADAGSWLRRVGVLDAKARSPILTLSGGNQQKVMVGRWLRREPAVLMLDEPTQGVDVGARALIYDLLRQAAASGRGVLVASSSTEELVELCHRVVVMAHGRQTAVVDAEQLSEDHLNALSLAPKQKA